MSDIEKIDLLEEEIIELKYQLKKSKDKEIIYLDILSNIDIALKTLFKREEENKRFDMGDVVDYRENLINLKTSLDEYIRIYKLRL
jgi:UTP-glucose-1-phosphate uridylyltransferase